MWNCHMSTYLFSLKDYLYLCAYMAGLVSDGRYLLNGRMINRAALLRPSGGKARFQHCWAGLGSRPEGLSEWEPLTVSASGHLPRARGLQPLGPDPPAALESLQSLFSTVFISVSPSSPLSSSSSCTWAWAQRMESLLDISLSQVSSAGSFDFQPLKAEGAGFASSPLPVSVHTLFPRDLI